jgi:hypothetical protein
MEQWRIGVMEKLAVHNIQDLIQRSSRLFIWL